MNKGFTCFPSHSGFFGDMNNSEYFRLAPVTPSNSSVHKVVKLCIEFQSTQHIHNKFVTSLYKMLCETYSYVLSVVGTGAHACSRHGD